MYYIEQKLFSGQPKITAICEQGIYLWIAFEAVSGSCDLWKVLKTSPTTPYIELSVPVDEITRIKYDSEGIYSSSYIYLAVDDADYCGIKYKHSNPTTYYYYIAKPVAITEKTVDVAFDSNYWHLITPGSDSGTVANDIIVDSTTVDSTLELTAITNVVAMTNDASNNLWAVTSNNPTDLIRIYDDGGYTFSNETVTESGIVNQDASRCIYYNNHLYICCNTNPVDLIDYDITDPENPTVDTYSFNSSGEIFINAQDIGINTTKEELYIACANGLVAKCNISDLTTRTEIDCSDTDELSNLICDTSNFTVYAVTDNSSGEMYSILDQNRTTLDTDFRTRETIGSNLDTNFIWTSGFKKINTDFRVRGVVYTPLFTIFSYTLNDNTQTITDTFIAA